MPSLSRHLVPGNRSVFADGAAPPALHLRVETGLDTVYLSRQPRDRWWRMEPVFDGETTHWLSSVYGEVHGVRFDRALFLSSHLSVVRMSYLALATTGVLSRFARHGPVPVPLGAAWRVLGQIEILCAVGAA